MTKAHPGFGIVWPEYRWVSAKQMRTWYSDALANGEVPITDRQLNVHEMAIALHQAGNITLRKEP